MNEQEIKKAKDYNVKLYPYYKMMSWDLLFFYSISYLFFNQVKGLSTSNILFGDSFYPLFKVIFQIPAITVVDKIGKRNSIILGNILLLISIIVILIFDGLICLIFSNIVMAAAFTLKGLCESNILDECITNLEKKNNIFSNIEGRSNSLWYFFNAVSSIISGFLFVMNPYIPMFISLSITFISCILSFKFKNYENSSTKKTTEVKEFSEQLKELKYSFKYIFRSNRLRNLLLCIALFSRLIGNSFYINK